MATPVGAAPAVEPLVPAEAVPEGLPVVMVPLMTVAEFVAVVVTGTEVVMLPPDTVVSTAPVEVVVWTTVVVDATEPEPEPVVVALTEAVSPALKMLHRASPADWAPTRSVAAVQAEIRQGAARPAMALLVGPHWQPTSVGAQPAAVMAEDRQEVCEEECISYDETWLGEYEYVRRRWAHRRGSGQRLRRQQQ